MRKWRSSRVLAAASLAGLAACSGPAPTDEGWTTPPTPGVRAPVETARLDAAWGDLIVVPAIRLAPAALEALRDPNLRALAHTDDGRPVAITVRFLTTRPTVSPALPPTNRRGWLPSVGAWSTSEPTPSQVLAPMAAGDAVSTPFAVFELPMGTLGQGVWLGETRLEVNWLQSSRTLADRLPGLDWSSPLMADAAASPMVRAALDAERESPFRRWRAKLAAGTLIPTDARENRASTTTPFDDPALELIAGQMEERWTVALGRLGEADPALYARVRRTLVRTAVIQSATGPMVAPVWPTDQQVLDELLAGLLAPRATGLQRKGAAEHFLEACPTAVGWIADDAAGLDARTLDPVVLVGAANFTGEPQAASVRWPRAAITPDLSPVPPMSSSLLTVPSLEGFSSPVRTPLAVRAGDWIGSPIAMPTAALVQPPGMLLAPLAADWSLAAWLASGEPGGRAPVALSLIRTPSPNPRSRPVTDGWVIYGEVAAAELTGAIRVWLGPAAAQRVAIVYPLAVPEAGAGRVRTFSIPIPADAINRGRLLIGIDADLSAGGLDTHWAWPRPMFPWQGAPSRAALDLTQWGGVAPPNDPMTR